MEFKFTDENFEKEVLQSEQLVVVDFYADWCGPCKMMGPVIKEIAEEFDGVVKVGKLNTDENTDTASKYKIMSIPTILFIKNGEIKETLMGVTAKEQIKTLINHYK